MHQIKSKYKNPDKYIEQLKSRADFDFEILNQERDEHDKDLEDLKGVKILLWVDNIIDENACDTLKYGEFNPNDLICTISRVIEVRKKMNENGKFESSIKTNRICTKKIFKY